MRTGRFLRLLAGTAVAATMVAPNAGVAAPDRIESVPPPPPLVNGQRIIIRRDAAPPAQRYERRRTTPHAPAPYQASVPAPVPPQAPRQRTVIDPDNGQLPPAPNDRATIQRDVAPAPQAAPAAATAPAVAVPVEGAQRASDAAGFDLQDMFDRLMGASDAQIGDKLRAIIAAKRLDRHIARPEDRRGVESFYAARNHAPLWIRDGRLTGRAKATIVRLKNAGAEGLDPADYPVPEFGNLDGADAIAAADIKLTDSVITFARHLAVGRIAPRRVSAEVEYGNHVPDPADVLKRISTANDIDAAFDSYDPPDAGFHALKRKLAELRRQPADGDDGTPELRIPDGPIIKPGASDPRVPVLRARLGLRASPDTTYDRALYNAVRALQGRHGARPDGIIGPQVIALVNGPKPVSKSQMIDKVLANMERWRWLPRDLGNTYVMVNVPDFSLKVVDDGRVVWRTKIVVGKPQTPTPLVSAPMDHIIVNPSWYVPQSIIENELLPAYETDPHIFERMGLEVKRGPDGHINVVQPPGVANALGRIKFAFPNKFQVYLHDTPEKRLFSYPQRAFSHGCMRVENPTKFGEVMLSLAMQEPMPNAQQLSAMFGQPERTFRLQKRPMVHLTYQTAFVDDEGKLQLRDDLYGFDERIHAILRSAERRIADVPPPPDPKRDLATYQANQEILRRVERREALNPFRFFERLFR
jgi:murein L,D-transpeptidase YcbB/YkuD